VLPLSDGPTSVLSLDTYSTLAVLFLSCLWAYNACVFACMMITMNVKVAINTSNAMRRDAWCDSYIVQSFNSGTEIADVGLGLPSPCVITNHVSCCCKHACFDVPGVGSANASLTGC
jgi:hypothetical protein